MTIPVILVQAAILQTTKNLRIAFSPDGIGDFKCYSERIPFKSGTRY
jgi:hypothetical protein